MLCLFLVSCSTDKPTEPEEEPKKWWYAYTDGYHILSLWQTSEETLNLISEEARTL